MAVSWAQAFSNVGTQGIKAYTTISYWGDLVFFVVVLVLLLFFLIAFSGEQRKKTNKKV
jgi:hypothetical protein